MSGFGLPAQPVDATQALNLSAGVSNCKVSRGRGIIERRHGDRMRRVTAIVSIVLAVLLVFASAAGTQAAPKMPSVAMLCAPACRGSNMDALYDELRKLGWIEDSTIVIE